MSGLVIVATILLISAREQNLSLSPMRKRIGCCRFLRGSSCTTKANQIGINLHAAISSRANSTAYLVRCNIILRYLAGSPTELFRCVQSSSSSPRLPFVGVGSDSCEAGLLHCLFSLDDGRKHAQDYSAEEAFASKPSLSRGYWQQCAIEWLTTRGSSKSRIRLGSCPNPKW